MNRSVISKIAIVVAMVALSSAFVCGEDSDRWQFSFAPYVWAVDTSGDISVGPIQSGFELPFSSALSQLQGGFFGHFEAGKNRFGIATDLFYVKVAQGGAVSLPLPGGSVISGDMTLKMTLWEVFPYYRFGEGDNIFDVFAGIRYNSTDTEIVLKQLGRSSSRTVNWTDPMIGGRWIVQLTPKVTLSTRADIAGFGAGSEFSFNMIGVVIWKFHRVAGLGVGYRVFDTDYTKESEGNPEFFKYNTTMHGPLFGITFSM